MRVAHAAARRAADRKYPQASPEGHRRVHARHWHHANLTLSELGLERYRFEVPIDAESCCAHESYRDLLESEDTETQRTLEAAHAISRGLGAV